MDNAVNINGMGCTNCRGKHAIGMATEATIATICTQRGARMWQLTSCMAAGRQGITNTAGRVVCAHARPYTAKEMQCAIVSKRTLPAMMAALAWRHTAVKNSMSMMHNTAATSSKHTATYGSTACKE